MVVPLVKLMKRYIKRGVSEANYRCSVFERCYNIYFRGKLPSFHFTVERDRIIVEEDDRDGHLILFLQYIPSLSEKRIFKSEVFCKYCDIFMRRYAGSDYGDCYASINPANCPFFGDSMYNLYSTLVKRFVYPFLDHLLRSKFHVISCNSRMITTPHITLESIGNFTYHDRFVFMHRNVEFTIDCEHPSRSIRRAIRFIMKVL